VTAAASQVTVARAAEHLLYLPYETWHFGDSISFEALLTASDVTGAPRYAAFAHGYFRAWASRAEPYRPLDHTAPGLAMVLCAEQTGDARLLEAAAGLADHLSQRRTLRGVYATWERSPLRHPYGSVHLTLADALLVRDPGAGVFVDCLHFDPPFFAALGRIGDNRRFAQLAVEQALGYAALLQDAETGLYHHFWLENTGRPYALGWGRGQGWALLGLLDVLQQAGWEGARGASARSSTAEPGPDRLPDDGLAAVATSARRLAEAMRSLQRPDGHWHAVAQAPDSGDETSTAAFMAVAFARGRTLGVLDEGFAEPSQQALTATLAATGAEGVLGGVSAAVWACTHPEHYHHVPRGFLVPWGQGPLVLALAAAAKPAGRD
jgi:unsaturated rhamnogalacturonyl hydrolase